MFIGVEVVPSTNFWNLDQIVNSPKQIYVGPSKPANYNTQVVDTAPFASNIAGKSNSVTVLAKDAFGTAFQNMSSNNCWTSTKLLMRADQNQYRMVFCL